MSLWRKKWLKAAELGSGCWKLQVVIAVGGLREVYLGTQDDADVLYLKNRYKKVWPNISLSNVIMKFSELEFPCLIFICFRHKKPACELWINFPAFVMHLICMPIPMVQARFSSDSHGWENWGCACLRLQWKPGAFYCSMVCCLNSVIRWTCFDGNEIYKPQTLNPIYRCTLLVVCLTEAVAEMWKNLSLSQMSWTDCQFWFPTNILELELLLQPTHWVQSVQKWSPANFIMYPIVWYRQRWEVMLC
jgi:hypothetical protein